MCGICGKVSFDAGDVTRETIHAMCDTLVHRGPDGDGIYVGNGVGLGQRRLSIIDLRTTANPPLTNEDQSIWIVFNGEIYNFQELRQSLTSRGHHFKTLSDTEVIVHAYEEYGIECLKQFRGMFAFALWDDRKKRLFAARDRFGKKPFVYMKKGKTLLFGSEIKAIAADPSVTLEPDYVAIDEYLTWQYVPSPRTAFNNISRLPPAHYLLFEAGNFKVERFWEPPAPHPVTMSEPEICERLKELLTESVRLRMIADVPLGAFLSGGLDSGVIVALMAQQSSKPIKTFTIGFEENKFDERSAARLTSEKYKTEHYELEVKPNLDEVLPLLVKHYNEPFADSSAVPTYYVARETRKHVTVALSGDGGDESFAGYGNYADVSSWGKLDWIPLAARKVMFGIPRAGVSVLPYSNSLARVQRAATLLSSTLPERMKLWASYFKPEEKRQLYANRLKGIVRDIQELDRPSSFQYAPGEDALSWMSRFDQNFYLPDCLMVKSDIASMACSLEVRAPLLDHSFAEFCAGIPSRMKRDPTGGKLIFKKAFGHLLPAELLTRPKTGFVLPFARWFRNELSGFLRGTLLDDRASKRGLFETAFVRRMIDEHVSGKREWSNRLWALMMLELWFREFID